MADVLECEIGKCNYLEEATSIGAAVTAGVGVGALEDFGRVKDFIRLEETALPDIKSQSVYRSYKEVFNAAYYALKPIYRCLARM